MDPAHDNPQDELASLEAPASVVEPSDGRAAAGGAKPGGKPGASPQFRHIVQWTRGHLNIYLLVFALLLLGAGVAGSVLYFNTNTTTNDILPQSLSQDTLNQLTTSDVNVGDPKHTLSVQSNAVFSGDVLVRNNLQIAGNLQVGSNLAIAGIRVTGNSTFDDVQITKSLAVTGNGSFQGQLNIQGSLGVNGAATFLGAVSAPSVTAGTLQISGDLNLTHHITAGGATPSRTNGPALGNGGTVSVSGSDIAGTITINTGGSPSIGCFVSITFASKFNATPHLLLTPVAAAAADLNFYVTRSTTSFSVCTTSIPPAGTTIVYDYAAFD